MTVGAAPIRFAKSGITAEWSRDKGSLLELAEAVGLAPVFGCRSGICGTCATRIASGAVEYVEEPLAPRGEDQVLLWCSVPAHGARALTVEDFHRRAAALRPREADADREVIAACRPAIQPTSMWR